ncbi:50S ribosomal protein L22 [Babesia caballi]|uniref:50S ribosomal protein L22 n=1 Tax=Babesia caballi TaxID=5871 RepID=A0AAV4LUV6_BABCB|nr:50S ribosomal protein L22 [Babesia caballi]
MEIVSAPRRGPAQNAQVQEINSPFPRKNYKADSACDRMIANSVQQWRKAMLDEAYRREFNWPYRKRHRGGRLDKLQLERRVQAVARWQMLSPIKVNKVFRQIRKLPVMVAMGDLAQRGANRYAVAVYKLIKSALTNAQIMYGKDDAPLVPRFRELSATSGGFIRRPLFRAKGRCDIIRKPKAHIRVVLTV